MSKDASRSAMASHRSSQRSAFGAMAAGGRTEQRIERTPKQSDQIRQGAVEALATLNKTTTANSSARKVDWKRPGKVAPREGLWVSLEGAHGNNSPRG